MRSEFREPTILGKTGLRVGRLGLASSYGAPSRAYEEAFDLGCNLFTVGSFMKGRSSEMIRVIRQIVQQGNRDKLVVNLMEYTHSNMLGKAHFFRGLKKLGTDHVDILTLGYYPRKPRRQVLDLAQELKEKGYVRHLALAGHNRKLFPRLLEDGILDVFQVRYNAVNSGAEKDIFPVLEGPDRPGLISYTATRWGQLLKESKMPEGETPLTAVECYRFVLSHPKVDVCMTGTRSLEMMRENLRTLDSGPLDPEEMERVRRIGDFIYGKPRE